MLYLFQKMAFCLRDWQGGKLKLRKTQNNETQIFSPTIVIIKLLVKKTQLKRNCHAVCTKKYFRFSFESVKTPDENKSIFLSYPSFVRPMLTPEVRVDT